MKEYFRAMEEYFRAVRVLRVASEVPFFRKRIYVDCKRGFKSVAATIKFEGNHLTLYFKGS